jgi:hypothetical protein
MKLFVPDAVEEISSNKPEKYSREPTYFHSTPWAYTCCVARVAFCFSGSGA